MHKLVELCSSCDHAKISAHAGATPASAASRPNCGAHNGRARLVDRQELSFHGHGKWQVIKRCSRGDRVDRHVYFTLVDLPNEMRFLPSIPPNDKTCTRTGDVHRLALLQDALVNPRMRVSYPTRSAGTVFFTRMDLLPRGVAYRYQRMAVLYVFCKHGLATDSRADQRPAARKRNAGGH